VGRSVTVFVAVSLVVLVMAVVSFGRLVTLPLVMMVTTIVLLLRAVMTLESEAKRRESALARYKAR